MWCWVGLQVYFIFSSIMHVIYAGRVVILPLDFLENLAMETQQRVMFISCICLVCYRFFFHFADLLTCPNSPAKELKIIRVFSKLIEQIEYPGPKFHQQLFHRISSPDTRCLPHQKQYALHEIVRKVEPGILEYDRLFASLEKQGKIPSQSEREKYRTLLYKTEQRVLSEGVDVVLCTCNEASSFRLTNSVNPVYCIIDECAMATEPECMVPIYSSEHVVLIGDHQQLSPVIKNREAEEMGLGTSLFSRYVDSPIGSGGAHMRPLQKPYMLRIQYRMVCLIYCMAKFLGLRFPWAQGHSLAWLKHFCLYGTMMYYAQ